MEKSPFTKYYFSLMYQVIRVTSLPSIAKTIITVNLTTAYD